MAGVNGKSGYATTTSNFTVPSVGSTVTVPVDNSAAFVVDEFVIATGPANFTVSAIPNPTSLTLLFLGNTGDVSPGATVASGSTIASAGSAGQNAFTTLTAQLTVPAKNATVTAAVANTAWMAVGQKVVISAPATFQVTTINSGTSVVLTFLGYSGDVLPTTVIAAGATVSPSGTEPSSGQTVSATNTTPYSMTTTPTSTGISLTIPAAGIWNITAFVNVQYSSDYNGFNGSNPITLSIQRTNNTPTTLTSTSIFPFPNTLSSVFGAGTVLTMGVIPIQLAAYSTAATNDQISIYASFVSALQAGSINVVGVSLVAQQIG